MDRARSLYESSEGWNGGRIAKEAARLASLRREAVEAAEREAVESPPGAILEIGPGPGRTARRFAAAGRRVEACDLAVSALAPLAGVAGRTQGDARRLPYREGSFACVYADSILMFLPPAEAFAEAARVLAPGGRAVFLEPLARNPFLSLYRRFDRSYESVARWRERGELLAAARASFARVREAPYYFFAPWTMLPDPWRRIGALDGPIARVFPDWAWMLLLVCEDAGGGGSRRRSDRGPTP